MIKPKKSLGQNFLIDKNIINKIIEVTDIKNKTILEVGPGTGNLTTFLLKKNPKKVFVIEKDKELVILLKKQFNNQISIINDDILNFNENSLCEDQVLVFGNLPYNISTEILSKWIIGLKDNFWFECLILMFQKEVADRIIAKVNTNKYGRLTILANWKFNVKKICDVSPNSFFPKPKVQSSVLEFLPKKKKFFIKDPKNIGKVTNVFFSQRRKMIKKPINIFFKKNFNYSKLQINPFDRPQNISIEKYFEITKEFESSLS